MSHTCPGRVGSQVAFTNFHLTCNHFVAETSDQKAMPVSVSVGAGGVELFIVINWVHVTITKADTLHRAFRHPDRLIFHPSTCVLLSSSLPARSTQCVEVPQGPGGSFACPGVFRSTTFTGPYPRVGIQFPPNTSTTSRISSKELSIRKKSHACTISSRLVVFQATSPLSPGGQCSRICKIEREEQRGTEYRSLEISREVPK